MPREPLVRTRSPAARVVDKRIAEFEAIIREHEMRGSMEPADARVIERQYEDTKRDFRNMLRSLLNLAEGS